MTCTVTRRGGDAGAGAVSHRGRPGGPRTRSMLAGARGVSGDQSVLAFASVPRNL